MNKKAPLVSILVITWDRIELTKPCLEALIHTTKNLNSEIIVVDNGSKDGTVKHIWKLHKEGLIDKVLAFDKNKGCGVATNRGMEMCEGEYIVEVDNDILLLMGWHEKCLEIFKNKEVGQIGIITDKYPIRGIEHGINTVVPNVAQAWMIRRKSYEDGARWCEDSWKKTPWQAVLFSAWFRSKGLLVGNLEETEKFAVDLSEGNHSLHKKYYQKTYKDRGIESLLKFDKKKK